MTVSSAQTNANIMPTPRLVKVEGHIKGSTRNALRRNYLSEFSLRREVVQRRNWPLANHPDHNLKFNSWDKKKLPTAEKKIPEDEWELRVGKLIPAFNRPINQRRLPRSVQAVASTC